MSILHHKCKKRIAFGVLRIKRVLERRKYLIFNELNFNFKFFFFNS